MTKLLNIDELIGQQRSVKIAGVDYPVADRTVKQVLFATKLQNKVDKGTEAEQFEAYFELVCQVLPSCPKEVMENLPVKTLDAILKFANEVEVEDAPEEVKESTEGK